MQKNGGKIEGKKGYKEMEERLEVKKG